MESEHSHVSVSISEHEGSHSDGLRVRQVIRDLLGTTAIFLVVFIALQFSIQNFRIDGASMSPTLENEQHILVSKLPYVRPNPGTLKHLIPFGKKPEGSLAFFRPTPPSHGEIIAFTYPLDPSKVFMKRVIGVPGDTIKLERGRVFRNGEPLDEPYVVNSARRSLPTVSIPENSYYVLGDNRPVSSDSRNWGFVPEEYIIGRVWFIYWPSDRFEVFHSLW